VLALALRRRKIALALFAVVAALSLFRLGVAGASPHLTKL
jgi:hypothetical protein